MRNTPPELDLKCGPLRDRMARFENYLPPVLTRWIMQEGETARMTPVEREVTVMFTDIAGFTAMAEKLPAAAVAAFLNEHFTLVAGVVEEAGGVVDKFLGDGVLAFWLDTDAADHAVQAANAALSISDAIHHENERREASGNARIRLRVGLQSGPAVVGSIGANNRMAFTIVGDTVNTAQRLEQHGKVEAVCGGGDVTIICGEAMAARLPTLPPMTPVGLVSLKGRDERIHAYRLEAKT